MSPTASGDLMSLKVLEVAKRAQRDPEGRLQSLAHLIDEDALERSYRRLRKRAAVGVVTNRSTASSSVRRTPRRSLPPTPSRTTCSAPA